MARYFLYSAATYFGVALLLSACSQKERVEPTAMRQMADAETAASYPHLHLHTAASDCISGLAICEGYLTSDKPYAGSSKDWTFAKTYIHDVDEKGQGLYRVEWLFAGEDPKDDMEFTTDWDMPSEMAQALGYKKITVQGSGKNIRNYQYNPLFGARGGYDLVVQVVEGK